MTLKDMLRERGLKQSWVASKIGMDEARFSDVVRGRRPLPLDKIEPLAILLAVDTTAIVQAATNGRQVA